MKPADKKRIFRLFATSEGRETLLDLIEGGSGNGEAPAISRERAERLYSEYIELSLSEKLRQTLLPERVSDRWHRLVDDICDLKRIDMLLDQVDEKGVVSLLDMKRKIKERMAKEFAEGSQDESRQAGEGVKEDISDVAGKILPTEAPPRKMQ